VAHPYFHAISSARKHGGLWSDYFSLHEAVDSTKSHYAHCKHRLILHNEWGIHFLIELYGSNLTRASDRVSVPTQELLEQHIQEDLGLVPSLADCFEKTPMPRWVNNIRDVSFQCRQSAAKFGGTPDDYLPLHQMFDQTAWFWDDPRHTLILHNSWGIYKVAEQVGPTYQRPSDKRVLPTRLLLEQHVILECGTIPSLKDNLSVAVPSTWTCSRARALSNELNSDPD